MHHHHHPAEHWAKRLDDHQRDVSQQPQAVVDRLLISEGMVVADIGAGTGYFEPFLSRAVGTGGTVLALDSSAELAATMQQRFDDAGLSNVEAHAVSHSDPGLAAGSVDRLLMVDVWHHLPHRVEYATKLRQALKANGRLIIVDRPVDSPEGPPVEMRVSPDEVVRELNHAGFTASEVADALPHQFMVVATLGA